LNLRSPASLLAQDRFYQALRDSARSGRHKNEIAQSYLPGATLSPSPSIYRDQVETVTSALMLPQSKPQTWPDTPPGADPLPGQLDRWLAARGAELVAVRRHLHAHPELSGQEFETAALVARELALASTRASCPPATA
jgi:amidohydrolase